MKALLRYAFLKSARDHSLVTLGIAPSIMVTAPMLGIAVLQILRGHGTYPLSIDMRTTPQETALTMTTIAAVMSVLVAGIAGFWLFRLEIGDRSIGTIVMAARARTISLVTTLYSAMIGTGAFLLALVFVALITAHLPAPTLKLLVAVICATTAAGAAGAFVVTVSAETAMLLPAIAAAVVIVFFAVPAPAAGAVAGSLVVSSAFVLAAAALLERRCAA